jgi:hypothetical protein
MTNSKKNLKNAKKKKVATEGKRNDAKKKNTLKSVQPEGNPVVAEANMNKDGGNDSVSFFILYPTSLFQGFKNGIFAWI